MNIKYFFVANKHLTFCNFVVISLFAANFKTTPVRRRLSLFRYIASKRQRLLLFRREITKRRNDINQPPYKTEILRVLKNDIAKARIDNFVIDNKSYEYFLSL